ncbi:hypothetical protein [Streptococcus acidominimus]|uniref:Cingulin n=1 Tax=Streptococcus acidominimus TaxID=1326 RepID=A0A1Q8ED19_STRAI|nr:hypothetical protein [Streptococcus acidominimus]OLF49685.1 hypothetical protein BU200_05985 [Streptococcus acidominimus]SUN08551.1 cingulin [Streptococcus acidominimus]
MRKDKHEEKRQELNRALLALEEQEDQFISLKKRFEGSLEEFYNRFEQLSRREEQLLHQSRTPYHTPLTRDLEYHQQTNLQMRRYVDRGMAMLADVQQSFKRSNYDQREHIIKERSQLPWD